MDWQTAVLISYRKEEQDAGWQGIEDIHEYYQKNIKKYSLKTELV